MMSRRFDLQERIYWQKKVEHIQNLEQGDTNKCELEQVLKEIHCEYEQLAKKNKEDMEKYKQKVSLENSLILYIFRKLYDYTLVNGCLYE
ncbi:hypothetical protein chiPu_0020391 [Chiloscyllium punctatum]|uniref:Uncharacterized protein n=1 Tax=Chiloscyllium punctatum TaxID=137246 RepID=A0A401RF42_CHIPU|nr:hypothetical protein [Chiloscyllium punctatum]